MTLTHFPNGLNLELVTIVNFTFISIENCALWIGGVCALAYPAVLFNRQEAARDEQMGDENADEVLSGSGCHKGGAIEALWGQRAAGRCRRARRLFSDSSDCPAHASAFGPGGRVSRGGAFVCSTRLGAGHRLDGNADRRTRWSNAGGSAKGYCHPDAGADRCTTAYGQLSDNDFTLGATTYVVESIRWGTGGSTNLHLTLDRDFPAADLDNLTLQVGSDTFALDDATRGNIDEDVNNNYKWTGTQAIRDLAADAEVTVKLLHVSGDATLSGLSLSDVTLDPVFASGTEAYTASAAYAVAQVTVTPTVNKSTATVAYLGTGDAAIDDADTTTAGHQADLSVGENTIKVRVTAPDATTQKTYTVTVTRAAAATDATLKSLALSEGKLAPVFASATTAYTAAVPSSVARVTLTPALNDARAKLEYLDGTDAALDDADGNATGFQANLSAGANTVKIKVTAEDGTTSTTYALTITRATPPMTAEAGVLVSNVGQSTTGFVNLSDTEHAQAFDTGGHAGGYSLESISLDIGALATSSTGVLTVTVREDNSGSPSGTVLYTLTNPSFSSAGVHEFTAPAGAMLDANATYHVMASYTSTVALSGPAWDGVLLSAGLDANAAAGWNIDAAYRHKANSATSWSTGPATRALKIQVKGAPASDLPKITISPAQPRVLGKLDTAFWNLTREGDTASALEVTVTLTPPAGNDWAIPSDKLSHDVTFSAGSSTAVLDNRLIVSGFKSIGFSSDATAGGTLTAGLGTVSGYDTADTAAVEVVIVTGAAWVIKLVDPAPRFSEAGGAQRMVVEAYATSADVPPPTLNFIDGSGTVDVSVITRGVNPSADPEAGKATSSRDFSVLTSQTFFPPSSFSAGAHGILRGRTTVTFTTLQDTDTEGDEAFGFRLTSTPGGASAKPRHFEGPDGTIDANDKNYPAVIEDDEITIESVAVTSTPKAKPDTYGAGELIKFTVTFSDPVTVTGTPRYSFTLGDANRNADWEGLDNERTSATHVFGAAVTSGDTDTDGIFLLGGEDFSDRTGPIALASSESIDDPGGVADTVVDLTWADRGIESGHKVDGSLAVPGAPGNLTAVAGDARVSLGWTGAAGNGFDILRYEYRYKSGTGDYPAVWTDLLDGPDAGSDPGDETFVTLTGLTNGEAHTFQLRAVNRLGDGESAESAAVTPAATACPAPTYTGGAREVLSAVMTAGTGQFLTLGPAFGFSSSAAIGLFGSLSPTEFTAASSYTIAFVADLPAVSNRFGFSTTSVISTAERPRLTVYVCGNAFRLGDADSIGDSGATFWFDNMKLGLAAGDTRVVRIGYDDVAPSLVDEAPLALAAAVLTLTFDEALDTGSVPDASAFTVEEEGVAIDLATANAVAVSASTVTLTLGAAPDTTAEDVTVSYTAPAGNPLRDSAQNNVDDFSETLPLNSPPTGKPKITGEARVGSTLTADISDIADADGLTKANAGESGFEPLYQWYEVDGSQEFAITNTNSKTYVPSASNAGKRLKVQVTLIDDKGKSENAIESDETPAVLAMNAVDGQPAISGFPRVGDVVTASKGDISDADGTTKADAGDTGYAYEYQWIRVDGTTETDIPGATSETYTLRAADMGKAIKVRVSFTDDAGNAESTTSAAFPNQTSPITVDKVLAAAVCKAPGTTGQREMWSATVTVGDLRGPGTGIFGR